MHTSNGDPAVEELWHFLAVEPDETVVITAVVKKTESERFSVCKASVLVGPPELGRTNWMGWKKRHHQGMIADTLEPPTPCYAADAADGLRICRVSTGQEFAKQWLRHLWHGEVAPALPPYLPPTVAALTRPVAPLFITPRLDTAASTFVTSAVRPARGFLFGGQPLDITGEQLWTANGTAYPNLPLWAGLLVEPGGPGGVLVARMTRQAWLETLFWDREQQRFQCLIGLEPTRTDPMDLVLTLEEWVQEELVYAETVSFEQLPDIDRNRGQSVLRVSRPTLGTQVRRQLRLYDREGNLLDATNRFWVIEGITLDLHVQTNGAQISIPVQIGQLPLVPSVLERAADIQRVQSERTAIFNAGATSTVVPKTTDVHRLMRSRLSQARRWLHVVDRYFGKDSRDWSLFDDVTVPIQVLTTVQPPKAPNSSTRSLEVRRWSNRPYPFHGRAYLWDGGGLAVDHSPNGFGTTLIFMTPLTAAQSRAWDAAFQGWWNGANSVP